MSGPSPLWHWLRSRLVCGLTAPVVLSLTGGAFADEARPQRLPAPAGHVASAKGAAGLTALRQLALEKAPAVAAARASLAAAEARSAAVENLGLTARLLSRDLPVRRQQASLGIVIAQGAVTQAEWDTLHGVTYCYLSAVYARQQLAVAEEGLVRLDNLEAGVRRALGAQLKNAETDPKAREFVDRYLARISASRLTAQARREEAVQGYERAVSALREAVGLAPDCLPPLELVELQAADPPDLKTVVAWALDRRGEMVQAANAETVTCLEIQAQKRTCFLNARTFASASDIHAREVPQGLHDDPYRPGAVALEMPVMLPGRKADRVNQASAYHARAGAVVEKTRNLLAMEAEQAYFRWKEAAEQTSRLREAATAARRVVEVRWQGRGEKVLADNVDQVIEDGLRDTDTTIAANQANYRRLLWIAALERVTAGAYDPCWAPAGAKEDADAAE